MPRWTPESRARQSALTQKQKPWQNSTGPRSKEGKNNAAKNALKHGMRSRDWTEFRKLLRLQREFVKSVR